MQGKAPFCCPDAQCWDQLLWVFIVHTKYLTGIMRARGNPPRPAPPRPPPPPPFSPSIIISYLVSGVAALLSGACYAELCTEYPVSGGAFSYILVSTR
jgi:amino acid transporter